VLFIWGLWLGVFENGKGDWPSDNEDLQSLLSTLGGIAATFFAVALNRPRQDEGDTERTHESNQPTVLSLPGASSAVLLRRTGLEGIGKASARVLGLVRLPEWEGLDRTVLVVFGTLLVLLFPLLTVGGFIEAVARDTNDVPAFIAKFAGPGLGLLVTAFALSASRLTRPR
jgi:hypothetical protein